MTSILARRKLARAALCLNRGLNRRLHSGGDARGLPPLIFVTDDVRVADPVRAARALPRGAAIILRHRDAAARRALAVALAPIARVKGLLLLIAGDPALADRVRAAGLHLPEARLVEAAHWRALRPHWLITIAAHGPRAFLRARFADAILLAPVFATGSHPDSQGPHSQGLGIFRFRAMAHAAPCPVYALGGIDAKSAARLDGACIAGLAAIGALLPD